MARTKKMIRSGLIACNQAPTRIALWYCLPYAVNCAGSVGGAGLSEKERKRMTTPRIQPSAARILKSRVDKSISFVKRVIEDCIKLPKFFFVIMSDGFGMEESFH